jgi:hypothetical protein
MSTLKSSAVRTSSGIALIVALAGVVVISAFSAALLAGASAEMQQAQTTSHVAEVRALAEGATMAAEKAVLGAVANTMQPPAQGTQRFGARDVGWTTSHIGADTIDTDAAGIQTMHEHWLVQSTAQVDGFRHAVHRVLDVGFTPIFQYAIFYENDLELLPGPSMTISGRVHTNHDLYVGVGDGNTLSIKSNYFRAVGEILRRRKDDGTATGGSVKIQKSGTTTLADMLSQSQLKATGVASISGFDSSFMGFDSDGDGKLASATDVADFTVGALTTWGGTVQSSAEGVKPVAPPSIDSIKRFVPVGAGNGDYALDAFTKDYEYVGPGLGDARKGRFNLTAGLVIRDLDAFDANGNKLTLPAGTLAAKTFYDARAGKTVTVTELDVGKLAGSGYFPKNGEIYASRSDTTTTQPNGIRLAGAQDLSAPLTVVSEDPVYVLGDYNSVNKHPASIIADAVNLLSNKWDDSKTKGTLPKATATIYNVALITGGDETSGSQYSGGFENLPRFHENWDGITASISGSFVKIYASQFATGKWVYGGDHYTAPIRNWDYDTSFNKVGNLPPFTPNVAQVQSVAWWE